MSPRFSLSQGPLILVKALEKLRGEIQAVSEESAGYDQLATSLNEKKQTLATLRERREVVDDERRRVERRLNVWQQWDEWRKACAQLERAEKICPAFPDEGVCGAFRRRCAQFGFVLRYPAGKEEVTGIGHEPWHFRYVGWPHAWLMDRQGLVLEEYIALLHAYPEQGPHLRLSIGGRRFEIFHIAQRDLYGLEARLPADLPCQISGDNVDGVVVTLWRDA